MQKDFTGLLLEWNRRSNTRKMPWKGEKDPYRIWLSEVILQQTRVEQGLAYYEKFIRQYPSIAHLAMAPDEEVFKCWEGLGYYSRCRNLLATARFVHFELDGRFPDSYEKILALKGVGPYTAAAIASFAFGAPFAVLDGNVFRVLSRYFGISTPIDTTDGKKMYAQLAQALLDFNDPAAYNQAIMDFGALVCKPQAPACATCVQAADCQANRHGWTDMLPVKSKTLVRTVRHLNYFILSFKDSIYVRQRTGDDIWKGLHEWVLWESDNAVAPGPGVWEQHLAKRFPGVRVRILSISDLRKQQLTHQSIQGFMIKVELLRPLPEDSGFQAVERNRLGSLAFPRYITRFLEEHPL